MTAQMYYSFIHYPLLFSPFLSFQVHTKKAVPFIFLLSNIICLSDWEAGKERWVTKWACSPWIWMKFSPGSSSLWACRANRQSDIVRGQRVRACTVLSVRYTEVTSVQLFGRVIMEKEKKKLSAPSSSEQHWWETCGQKEWSSEGQLCSGVTSLSRNFSMLLWAASLFFLARPLINSVQNFHKQLNAFLWKLS